jgi:hypothetical protein
LVFTLLIPISAGPETSTVALTTAAPDGSLTTPCIPAVVSCAHSGSMIDSAINTPLNSRRFGLKAELSN